MPSPDELPGTYRVADGSKVAFSDAMATWIPLAYDELVATARRYHAVITYLELSQRLSQSPVHRVDDLGGHWARHGVPVACRP